MTAQLPNNDLLDLISIIPDALLRHFGKLFIVPEFNKPFPDWVLYWAVPEQGQPVWGGLIGPQVQLDPEFRKSPDGNTWMISLDPKECKKLDYFNNYDLLPFALVNQCRNMTQLTEQDRPFPGWVTKWATLRSGKIENEETRPIWGACFSPQLPRGPEFVQKEPDKIYVKMPFFEGFLNKEWAEKERAEYEQRIHG